MSENGTDKETTERDYKSDLLICDGATLGPWKLKIKGNSVQSFAINGVCSGMKPRGGDAHFIALARTALPWYIKRCMELEGQLHQAEEREVKYREALENEVMYHGKNCACRSCQALSSTTHPSRYREALAVVVAARKFIECSSADMENACLGDCDKKPCPWNALESNIRALDKAGEGAGK